MTLEPSGPAAGRGMKNAGRITAVAASNLESLEAIDADVNLTPTSEASEIWRSLALSLGLSSDYQFIF